MATMKEIADLAGVSRGTVDRVLNHRGIVNSDTEKRVLEVAALLNYQPNKAGMALAAQKKKLKIGVLLFSRDNPFFDEVIDGLNKKAQELSIYGCTIITKQIAFHLEEQLSTIDAFVASGIHGLILSPYNDISVQQKIDDLMDAGIPCVTVNTDIPNSKRIAYVGSDFYKCGQTAAGLLGLITGGAATVGIITGSHQVLCHEERISGFLDTIHTKYPNITVAELVENHDDDYESYEVVSRLLKEHPSITALYFTAAGVYGGCKAVTNNVSLLPRKIVTFDTVTSTVDLMKQGLISATICQQPAEQGAVSLCILIDYMLSGNMPEVEYHYMDLSIKIKENL